jgi:glycosyltransferase involved in cell wall biosynthesis
MENTNKPTCVVAAPVATVSGYGARSRDLVRALIALDKYDVKIISTRWGATPLNALIAGKDDDIISRLTGPLQSQPDLFIQVTVPNEFQPVGKYNIGVTAGIETTQCSADWLEGCNRMNLVIVPSKHSKDVFLTTKYDKLDKQTQQKVGVLELVKDIEVLFEGVNLDVYKKTDTLHKTVLDEFAKIKNDFCFLSVGHWMQGDLGEDRKNMGMLVYTFLDTFKNTQNPPALVLKTSGGTFSHIDRLEILRKIDFIKQTIKATRLPDVYVLHGDLSDAEMNSLYMHPKVKAHISLTKGEGFGRPLAEASVSGKPIIATNWSGHVDFLDKDYSILVPGALNNVHPSAAWDNVILPESKWFTADYGYFMGAMKDVNKNYNKYLEKSRKTTKLIKDNFSWTAMKDKLGEILERVPEFPKVQALKLPQLKKIELPKLTKIEDK